MTVDEMERVLDTLGVEYVSSYGDEIRGYCPAHKARTGKDDRNPSWYINAETGAHICFSCQFKGSTVSLVSNIKGIDFDEAREWLVEGGELTELFERAINKPKEAFEEVIYISEASLAAFTTPPEHALKARGLSAEACAKHEVLWDRRRELWIIPQRELGTGKLLGWQEKGFSNRYFKNYPVGVKKSECLFGYQQYSDGNMIVVESPLDVVRLESIGISGAVAVYGSQVSDKQLAFIRNADRIIFAMDSDHAGVVASNKMLKATQYLDFEAWFFNYDHTDMKDVGGMSKTEVLHGIDSAVHSVRYMLPFVTTH